MHLLGTEALYGAPYHVNRKGLKLNK